MSRYYDPALAQFISEDSYRGDGEAFWHLYAYCEGDPVNYTDRTGNARKSVVNNTNKNIKYFYETVYTGLVKEEIKKKLNPGKYSVKFRDFKQVKGYDGFEKSYTYGMVKNLTRTVEYFKKSSDGDFDIAYDDARGYKHIRTISNIVSWFVGAYINNYVTGVIFSASTTAATSMIKSVKPKFLGKYTCYTGYISFSNNEYYFKYYRDPGGLAKGTTSTISFVPV